MLYYIKETIFDKQRKQTAASKAREDANTIAEKMGFLPIDVEYDYSLRAQKGFAAALVRLTKVWSKALKQINDGDVLFIQFPLNHHPLNIGSEIDSLHKRGGQLIVLIHDIDSLRMKNDSIIQHLKYLKVKAEDKNILGRSDVVIAHNPKMIKEFMKYNIDSKKLISLDIFDYLHDVEFNREEPRNDVVIAGVLRKHKAGYIYSLPDDVSFGLYGVGYENQDKENVKYYGSFDPEELVGKLSGKFGLVWDGPSSKTCEGLSGKYLKLNNPHKTSLYLSARIPIIVWENAAIADFVIINKCGMTVKSILDIHSKMLEMTEEEYMGYKKNACRISERIKSGFYLKKAIKKAISII